MSERFQDVDDGDGVRGDGRPVGTNAGVIVTWMSLVALGRLR